MTLLEVKNVSKEYVPGVKALSDINFSIQQGEIVSIIGPSGAGKSTLLRCLNRMIDATEGEIIFDGVNVLKLKKQELRNLRREIGMVFQHSNLVDRLTVMENVLHGRLGYTSTIKGMFGIFTKEDKQEAEKIIQMLGLSEQINQRADSLSGGQQQRVGISRALIQQPKLILADEPIASLDPSSSRVIMDYFKDINQQMGITVLLNLHQVDVALKYSDRIIGVNGGKIVFEGLPSQVSQETIQMIYGADAEQLIMNVGE
ncbi:phosphonate ABC transporter ATP-binding protein [Vaginisenegalia massiliensis]|uniref:phosphonate ABC transporter ATP-binding protein n=1 Tax=Vaginisenegalia massiliensis TaxID=2058294 RepID=UPI000F527498|nr:phosphonate ABC transporter ATP-binding protein [Vaginisenegalia massiliensis]